MNSKNRKGQGLTEYGLILTLISLMGIMVCSNIRDWVSASWTNTSDKITTASDAQIGGGPSAPAQ